jgi:hypothetical protein
MKRLIALLALLSPLVFGQATHDFRSDIETDTVTVKSFYPGACSLGALLIRSDQTNGQNFYIGDGHYPCTWSLIGGSGTSTNGTNGQGLTSDGSGGFGTPVTLAASATTDTTNASNISSGTLNAARLPAITNGTNGQGLTSNGSGGFGTPVTLAASATTDATNASNISSGTLNAARLPNVFPFTVVQQAYLQSGGSNTTSYTATFPQATAASGNTAFMIVGTDGAQAITTPSGWTVDINKAQTSNARLMVLHKTTAAESSATFTVSSGTSFSVIFFEVSGSHALDASTTGGQANALTVVLPAITPTAGAVVFGMAAFVMNNDASACNSHAFTSSAISPNWHSISVCAGPTTTIAGRALSGYISTVAASAVSTTPPVISMPDVELFSGGGMAYATFSIL